jgi:pantoate--beta-alanine ligase
MSTKLVTTIADVKREVARARARGDRIGFIPTMGALHKGHLSLIKKALGECDYVVVSIFVNPTQFGPTEDYKKYPRTLEEDRRLCAQAGVHLIFAPKLNQMYPAGFATYVTPEESLAGCLCGKSRPGHFRGVDTVVLKLFNIVLPDAAYFGQKDFQQCVIIEQMVCDFNLDVNIRVLPTVREPDGLAISSRNSYLSSGERKQAVCLYQALEKAKELVECEGVTAAAKLKCAMRRIIMKNNLVSVDYAQIVHPQTLEPLKTIAGKAVAALAVFIGKTRLIDNIILRSRKKKGQRCSDKSSR